MPGVACLIYVTIALGLGWFFGLAIRLALRGDREEHAARTLFIVTNWLLATWILLVVILWLAARAMGDEPA